mmetsp:Transcript_33026/g.67316  ORF Transcript_33026/g.67316 Transcript_33026/m.67316 type:complete len:617 (-) Transcript_33026:164-2014(-)
MALTTKNNDVSAVGKPILRFRARNVNSEKCPFLNSIVSFDLYPSSCLHLGGQSGAGKTTLALYIAGLLPRNGAERLRHSLGIDVEQCQFDESIPQGERVGMLFQQTTLLDSLTVAGNVCVALENCPSMVKSNSGKQEGKIQSTTTQKEKQATIKRLLETVGLNYLRDGPKRPSQLSGGMARRASLALQLAQHKHVIVLDEPFAGLDHATAVEVAKELKRLREEKGTALVLISHEPEIVDVVMGRTIAEGGVQNETKIATQTAGISDLLAASVVLQRRLPDEAHIDPCNKLIHPSLYGKDSHQRFLIKLVDYFLYSLPLIVLTFIAAGLAISMLSSDILRRVDVTEPVLSIVEKEVKPLIKMFTGEEHVNPMYTMMINMKVRGMLNTTIPPAKATLYALGMAKLFVLEIGPLITSLLLSGRIGGSYAGEVATMQATAQNKLLTTLGISPVNWTFAPSLLASWLSSPLLTLSGTFIALEIGAHIGPQYGIGDSVDYRKEVWDAIFLPLRLRGIVSWSNNEGWEHGGRTLSGYMDLRCTFSDSLVDAAIEVTTHPVFFHLIKSLVFMTIIMGVAESAARRKMDLTPREVPRVITTSVVGGSLLVIFADWGFSQLLLLRH